MPARATQTQAQADLAIERLVVLRRIADHLRAASLDALENLELQLGRGIEQLRSGGTFHLSMQEVQLLDAFRDLPLDEHRQAVVEGLANFIDTLE